MNNSILYLTFLCIRKFLITIPSSDYFIVPLWLGPALPDPGQLLPGLGQQLFSNRDGQFEMVRCLFHRSSNNQHILVSELIMRVLQKSLYSTNFFYNHQKIYLVTGNISTWLDSVMMTEEMCQCEGGRRGSLGRGW